MPADERPVVAILTNLEADADYLFPGYPRVMLNEDYHRSIAAAGGVPVLLPPTPDVSLLAPQLDLVDAVVLAGGQDVDPLRYGESPLVGTQMPNTVRDAYEVEALRLAFALDLPVLAICRGVQLLNVWLGGTLFQDNALTGSSLRHVGTGEPEAAAHAVEVASGSFLEAATGKGRLLVNSFHHQSVARVAPGLSVVAVAPDGIVEAVELTGEPEGRPRPTAPVVGVQWHPEMSSRVDADSQAIFRWFVGQASGTPIAPRRAVGGATRTA